MKNLKSRAAVSAALFYWGGQGKREIVAAGLEGRGYGTEKDFGTGVRFSQSLKTPALKNPPNRRYKKGRRFFGVLNLCLL